MPETPRQRRTAASYHRGDKEATATLSKKPWTGDQPPVSPVENLYR